MNITELIELIQETPIDEKNVELIEKKYECSIPKLIKHIISYDAEDRFSVGCRLLTFDEIVKADDYLGLDLSLKKLIPIIDTFDNDFILYDAGNGNWIKMNIVDECIFEEAIT